MSEHNFEYKIVDLPAKKVNGSTYIDIDFLLYMIDFMEKLDHKPKKQEIVKSFIANEFAKKVKSLWSDCIAKGPKAWKNNKNVIGEALMVDYTFDSAKLAAHANEIYELIILVHNATTYEEMKFLNNGEKWSELRQPVSFLMALGNALHFVDFKNDRRCWNKKEEQNPEIIFTLK